MEPRDRQRAALEHVAARARGRRDAARARVAEVLRMSDLSPGDFDAAQDAIRAHARVALHFHPDRLGPGGLAVGEALRRDGVYRSQFETGLSNGKVDPAPGGARDRWEARLFGDAYVDAPAAARPRYGALDLLRHPDGPAPRFGSCYLLLRPAATARCTFTYMDSHQDPPEKGTAAELDDVLAALFVEVFLRDFGLGEHGLTPAALARRLREDLARPYPDPARGSPRRNLNHYVEAQVHGEVRLVRDAEALVVDPSFRGTATGEHLAALAAEADLELRWTPGFRLPVDRVPRDFRGPRMPAVAARVARGGAYDAADLGAAAAGAVREPGAWADLGELAEVLQLVKLAWHCLVKFGEPPG